MAVSVVRLTDNATLWELGAEQGVTRMRYVTHPELVKEVCPQCLYYHDTVWDQDNPLAPEPPLHPMCACTMEPEFDPGSELGQDPDGEPIVAEPAPELKPGEYLTKKLASMPVAKQQKVIGVVRTTLLRADLIEVTQLMRRASGLRSVDSLLKSTPNSSGLLPGGSLSDADRRVNVSDDARPSGEQPRGRVSSAAATTLPNLIGCVCLNKQGRVGLITRVLESDRGPLFSGPGLDGRGLWTATAPTVVARRLEDYRP